MTWHTIEPGVSVWRPRNGQPSRGEGRQRWNSCERKDRFADEHEANRRAKRFGLRAYECDACAGYHLTSKGAR